MTSLDRILVTSIAVELSASMSSATRRESSPASRSSRSRPVLGDPLPRSPRRSRRSSASGGSAARSPPCAVASAAARHCRSRRCCSLTGSSSASPSAPRGSPRPAPHAVRDHRGDRLAGMVGRLVGGLADAHQSVDQLRPGVADQLRGGAVGLADRLRRAPAASPRPRATPSVSEASKAFERLRCRARLASARPRPSRRRRWRTSPSAPASRPPPRPRPRCARTGSRSPPWRAASRRGAAR